MKTPDLSDAVTAAPALLGWRLVHDTPEGTTSGIIVETEAYSADDAASHSYRGQTARNGVMFGPAGHLYVYFTYGMHYCINVVTGPEGSGQAVLIRALQPSTGIELMFKRRNLEAQTLHLDAAQGSQEERASRTNGAESERLTPADTALRQEPAGMASFAGHQGQALRNLCNGPAKLTQAMGISMSHNGSNLLDSGSLRLEAGTQPAAIVQTTRIGIRQAVDVPWRFFIAGNQYVSRPQSVT